MKIAGFSFTKISVEKFNDRFENLKINTNINVSEIHDVKSGTFKIKDDLLGIKFTYAVDYDPEIAKLEFVGTVLVALDSKTAKEVLQKWKDKKIPQDFQVNLFNLILRKANIKAFQLEDEMNLPLHVVLPRLQKQDSEENQDE